MIIYQPAIHDWRVVAIVAFVCIIGYLGSKARARREAHKRCEMLRSAFDNNFYE